MADFIKEIGESFLSGDTEGVVDIMTFVEIPWGLNMKLRPVQGFILKVYYGLPLNDKERTIEVPDVINERILYRFTEVEFLEWLYDEGQCNTKDVEGKTFRELDLVAGRRGGKSTLSACISCYELYKLIKRGDPSNFYGFPPETDISIINVAPTDEQADVVFNMLLSMVKNCPFLRDRSINQTQTYFNLQTDADRLFLGKRQRASVTARTGGCSSNSLRGRNAIVVVMDEFAHFIDNSGRFSGSEVYKALTPSTTTFERDGKIICISSPYAKYGAFWDRYNQSFQEPDTTLMFKMYSALMNPAIDSSILRTERRRDKIGFVCEYGAEFSDSVVAWIEDEKAFRNCVTTKTRSPRGQVGTPYFMGVDLGIKNDGTAVAIVHRDPKTKKIILDYATVWFSGSSDVWDIDGSIYKNCSKYEHNELLRVTDVVDEIAELHKWFPIQSGWFDQHDGYSLMELLHAKGLKQFRMEHVTDTMNNRVYQLTKMLYLDGLLDLYDHPVLVPEMLSLEAERKSKQRIAVRAPNKRGAHDDISDAYVRAVWEAYNHYTEKQDKIASLVGRAGVVKGARGAAQMTMLGHRYYRRKIHGDPPRQAPSVAGRRRY